MNFRQTMDYLRGVRRFGSRPGLAPIRALMAQLGNPQQHLRFVHVAGTNGKGSTVAFLSSILTRAGYRVGVYTSPYIQRFTERIRVGSEEITQCQVAEVATRVRAAVEALPPGGDVQTEFDVVTAMALCHFAQQKCDIVVLETGLGGRLDSTNCIPTPEAAVITTVDYDHMEVLGGTLEQIAWEKAGIIKPGGDVVLYPQPPQVEAVFERVCAQQGATLHRLESGAVQRTHAGLSGQHFSFGDFTGLQIGLLGPYQVYNAALAVQTVRLLGKKGWAVPEEAIRTGLRQAVWPGRFELLRAQPPFLVDGGHNVQGAKALAQGLRQYFPGRRFAFVVGVLADKQYEAMLEHILPLASRFLTVAPDSPRALPAAELAKLLQTRGYPAQACGNIRAALDALQADEAACAFGSLYFIGEVRACFGCNDGQA